MAVLIPGKAHNAVKWGPCAVSISRKSFTPAVQSVALRGKRLMKAGCSGEENNMAGMNEWNPGTPLLGKFFKALGTKPA